jgi:hypothetical protein
MCDEVKLAMVCCATKSSPPVFLVTPPMLALIICLSRPSLVFLNKSMVLSVLHEQRYSERHGYGRTHGFSRGDMLAAGLSYKTNKLQVFE